MGTYYAGMMNSRYSRELRHHGIIGQKWGVQNGPPYPLNKEVSTRIKKAQKMADKIAYKGIREERLIKDHILPVGTVLYRSSTNKDEQLTGPSYFTYYDPDRNMYRSGRIDQNNLKGKIYEKSFVVKKDLNIAGRKVVEKEVSDLIHKDKKYVDKLLGHLIMHNPSEAPNLAYNFLINNNIPPTKENLDWAIQGIIDKTRKQIESSSDETKITMAIRAISTNKEYKDSIVKSLQSKGYDGMSDLGGVGGRKATDREGIDPLIIFDTQNDIENISQHKVGGLEGMYAYYKHRKWKSIANSKKNEANDW